MHTSTSVKAAAAAEGVTRMNLGFIGVDFVTINSAEHIKTAIDSGDLERMQVRSCALLL